MLRIDEVLKGDLFQSCGHEVVNTINNNELNFVVSNIGNCSALEGSGNIAIIKAYVLKEGAVTFNTTDKNVQLSIDGINTRIKLSNNNAQAISYKSDLKELAFSKGNQTTTYEETNSLIKYTGNWTKEKHASNSEGNAVYANQKGSKIEFSFEGTGFKWYGLANSYKGIADVYVDGKKVSVDGYSKTADYQHLFYEVSGLAEGKHTVVIEVTGTKSSAAQGTLPGRR